MPSSCAPVAVVYQVFLTHIPHRVLSPLFVVLSFCRPQEECEKFGSVKSVHIPRPSTTSEAEKPGVGYVFVAFDAVDSASKAAASLRARTFDGRKVPIVRCLLLF